MRGTQREKKITVKFFLNEAVEPVEGKDKKKYYPLYVQVTYNRKNMQFKSKYSEYYESLDEVKAALLQFEEKVITNIIAYEANKEKGEYDLKGLKRKYEIYSTSILEALEQYLKPKVRLAVLKTGSALAGVLNFNDPNVTTSQLYEAAKLMFKALEGNLTEKLKVELDAYDQYQKLYRPVLNYGFPTLIEWVDESYSSELEKKLTKALGNKPDLTKAVRTLIGHAVGARLKELEG